MRRSVIRGYPYPKPGSRHSLHFVRDFVHIDAAVVGFLLVIAIPALQTGQRVGRSVTNRSDPQQDWTGGQDDSRRGWTRWKRGCVEG